MSTFGTATVGPETDNFGIDRKRVNKYTLATTGQVTKLSVYLEPWLGALGEQKIRGVVYADEGGAPGAKLGQSSELVFHGTDAPGWYDLIFSTPAPFGEGTVWIGAISGGPNEVCGVRWQGAIGARVRNNDVYVDGASDPFNASGATSTDGEQFSLYATFEPLTPTIPGSIWRGDGSVALEAQWPGVSNELECGVRSTAANVNSSRVALVTSGPALTAAQRRAIHFHMEAADKGCFAGRSELAQGNHSSEAEPPDHYFKAGDDVWIALQAYYPASYPLNSTTCADGGTLQFHEHGGPGSPPFGIGAGRRDGKPSMIVYRAVDSTPGGATTETVINDAVQVERWYDLVIHARFSEATTGLVEVWLDGVQVLDLKGIQFGLKTGYNPSHARIGLYPDTARSESPAFDLYVAGYNVASSRAVAEAIAFGSAAALPATVGFTLTASPTFPRGASIGAYLRSRVAGNPDPRVPPLVAPVATATVDDQGFAAFTGLTPNRRFVAGGLDAEGAWRWIRFRTLEGSMAQETARATARELELEAAIIAGVGGSISSWGDATNGSLGIGLGTGSSHFLQPTAVPNLTGVVQIVAGFSWMAFRKADGSVWFCGNNTFGTAGLGSNTQHPGPVQITTLPANVISIAGNGTTLLALLSNGEVLAWGGSGEGTQGGQLGNGADMADWTPHKVEVAEGVPITNVVQIDCGHASTFYLKSDGTVWRSGSMSLQGNLYYATQVAGISNVAKVVGTFQFMLCLLNDGTVRTKGRNQYGQLCNGVIDKTSKATLTWEKPPLTGVQDISISEYHAAVLLGDETVRTWGRNNRGQLGKGTVTIEPPGTTGGAPNPVDPGVSGVVELVARGGESSGGTNGEQFTLVRLATGGIEGWGGNNHGELGDGTTITRPSPTPVALGVADARGLGASESHAGVLRPVPPVASLSMTATPGAKSLLVKWVPVLGDRVTGWKLEWRRVEQDPKPKGKQEALKHDSTSLSLSAGTTSHLIQGANGLGLPDPLLWSNATNLIEVRLAAIFTPVSPTPTVVNEGGGKYRVTWAALNGPDGLPEPGWIVTWNAGTGLPFNKESAELPAGVTSYTIEGGPTSGLEAKVKGSWDPLWGVRELEALPEGMAAEVPWPLFPPQLVHVSNKPKVGQKVKVTVGLWAGATPITSRAYQWFRQKDGTEQLELIEGATASEYTLTEADIGYAVRVAENPSNAVGESNLTFGSGGVGGTHIEAAGALSPPGYVVKA